MNKTLVIGVVAILIIVGAVSMFSNDAEPVKEGAMVVEESQVMMESEGAGEVVGAVETESEAMVVEGAMMSNEEHGGEAMEVEGAMMMASAGTYEEYSPEKVSNATTEKVVIYFKASWCPSCRIADANIKSNLDNIPSNLTLLHTDYDTAKDLKKKYGVRTQHTFVQVDKNGEFIKLWVGSMSLEKLVKEIE
ncbi:MAG: thioredoxin family protein [Candidatus Pacebacteria bacterium]|nr:thioredoxin family protein [Candidatus Paceibacterota bacterium]